MIKKSPSASLILNIISAHPREEVPLLPRQWKTFFPNGQVPALKRIRDKNGDISLIIISKQAAINYLKETYGFKTRAEIRKELKDVRRSDV